MYPPWWGFIIATLSARVKLLGGLQLEEDLYIHFIQVFRSLECLLCAKRCARHYRYKGKLEMDLNLKSIPRI